MNSLSAKSHRHVCSSSAYFAAGTKSILAIQVLRRQVAYFHFIRTGTTVADGQSARLHTQSQIGKIICLYALGTLVLRMIQQSKKKDVL